MKPSPVYARSTEEAHAPSDEERRQSLDNCIDLLKSRCNRLSENRIRKPIGFENETVRNSYIFEIRI
jgi:hypothetical protein